jgi:hypothetical protein
MKEQGIDGSGCCHNSRASTWATRFCGKQVGNGGLLSARRRWTPAEQSPNATVLFAAHPTAHGLPRFNDLSTAISTQANRSLLFSR